MDLILQLLNIDPAVMAKMLPIIVLSMGILSGVSMMVGAISKFTNNVASNKAAAFLAKVLDYGKKIVDFFSGNVKH